MKKQDVVSVGKLKLTDQGIYSKSITNTTSNNIYMQDVMQQGPLISAEAEAEIIERILNGDQSARTELANNYLRLVLNIARKFFNLGMSNEDVVQEGNLGLMQAAKKYDPSIAKFSTHATWWIRQSILRALQEKRSSLEIPVYLLEIIEKMPSYIAEFEANSTPVDCEVLAIKMGLPLARVARAYSLYKTRIVASLDCPITSASDGTEVSLSDYLIDENANVELIIETEERTEIIKKFVIENTKNSREAKIIFETFGIGIESKRTLEDIGNELNLTRERVRQIQNKVLSRWQTFINGTEKQQKMMESLREYLRE